MLLIRNARLFTMEGDGYIEGGDVLMEAGKIVATGANLSALRCESQSTPMALT